MIYNGKRFTVLVTRLSRREWRKGGFEGSWFGAVDIDRTWFYVRLFGVEFSIVDGGAR